MSDPVQNPPIGTEVDLRDFRWMKLDVTAVLNSDFNLCADDTAWRCGVTLWLRSWHQVPAGSLPSDEGSLCGLSGLGRDLRSWRKVRELAMHGFVLCSDGRFYHPVICRLAKEAHEERLAYQARKERDRSRKRSSGIDDSDHEISNGIPLEQKNASSGIPLENDKTPPEIAVEGQGQGQGQKERNIPSLRSGIVGAETPTPSAEGQVSPTERRKKRRKSAESEKIPLAIEAWNAVAERTNWPKALRVTNGRATALAARLAEIGLDGWKEALERAALSDF